MFLSKVAFFLIFNREGIKVWPVITPFWKYSTALIWYAVHTPSGKQVQVDITLFLVTCLYATLTLYVFIDVVFLLPYNDKDRMNSVYLYEHTLHVVLAHTLVFLHNHTDNRDIALLDILILHGSLEIHFLLLCNHIYHKFASSWLFH